MNVRITLLILFFLPFSLFAERVPILLRHALTDEQLAQGLMGCKSLGENEGMTFNFRFPETASFWMYNCYLDLAVAFLDQDKIIREIHEMKAYPKVRSKTFFQKRTVKSSFPVSYALEMNAGWFTKHGINPGARAYWSILSPEGYIEKN